jgi:hypothetical protein
VLDINLGSETSEAVVLKLAKYGTQFVTLSGYPLYQHPSAFNRAAAVAKPLGAKVFNRRAEEMRDRRCGGGIKTSGSTRMT